MTLISSVVPLLRGYWFAPLRTTPNSVGLQLLYHSLFLLLSLKILSPCFLVLVNPVLNSYCPAYTVGCQGRWATTSTYLLGDVRAEHLHHLLTFSTSLSTYFGHKRANCLNFLTASITKFGYEILSTYGRDISTDLGGHSPVSRVLFEYKRSTKNLLLFSFGVPPVPKVLLGVLYEFKVGPDYLGISDSFEQAALEVYPSLVVAQATAVANSLQRLLNLARAD
ncbi:hypothetical protein TIFTF001_050711 [Ficus carica]|uniref:Uncharacterized protein n=1 Tax=Ficus carica TaxID=3494 RepID=A0AA88CTI7_FICCA|nr:hypothetical protein TIFTF001_050711 [Ficus carica]